MDRLLGPKLTDQEVAEGAPARDAFRKLVIDRQTFMTSSLDIFMNTGVLSSYKSLLKFVEKELAWVNANIEVSKRSIETRRKEFQERYDTLLKDVTKAIEADFQTLPGMKQDQVLAFLSIKPSVQGKLRKLAQAVMNQKQEQQSAEIQQKLKRSPWDIFKDAFAKSKGRLITYFWLLLFVILGLRAASFAANENLWKPLPYRILIFIYTFLFFPVTIPYYGYRELRAWLSGDPEMKPRMEGLFPKDAYEPTPDLILSQRFFGYADTPGLQQWMQSKRDQYQADREQSLKSNLLAELQAKRMNPM